MHGLCNLMMVPVRKEPSSKSEMVTQLIFGEIYKILKQEGSWFQIESIQDGYVGYINDTQVNPIQYQNLTNNWIINIAFPFHQLNTEQGPILVPFGGFLPATDKVVNIDFTPHQAALLFLNTPYLWGGKTPAGIDCSGLTQICFRACGASLPRDAYQQVELGETVSFVEASLPGDLAFFDNEEGSIVHVGIMLPNQQIIHAAGKVRVDSIDHYGIIQSETGNYSHKLRIIKRIKTNSN